MFTPPEKYVRSLRKESLRWIAISVANLSQLVNHFFMIPSATNSEGHNGSQTGIANAIDIVQLITEDKSCHSGRMLWKQIAAV